MDDPKTVWVGNLADQVTEELLYELFLQAGPLERVKIPTDREGRKSNFGFITFKHEVSVPYCVELLNGTRLFEKNLNIKPRTGGVQKGRQGPQHNIVERSISYPNDSYQHQQNDHKRFNDIDNNGPQHISYEDLLKMGPMMNVGIPGIPYPNNFGNDFGQDFGHNRHHNEKNSFRDGDRERDRKDYDGPRNDYKQDRERHHDYPHNRNHRRNHDRKNYDRNGGRRNHRFY